MWGGADEERRVANQSDGYPWLGIRTASLMVGKGLMGNQ